jgi:hypothetical protein
MDVDLVQRGVALRTRTVVAVALLSRGRLAARPGLSHCRWVAALNGVVMSFDSVRVTFLSRRVLVVRVVVSVRVTAVAVSDVVEENKAYEVRRKTQGTDNEHQHGLRNLLRLYKSLNRFEEDGETESNEENAVDERAQCLCALPLYVVSPPFCSKRQNYSHRRCTSWSLTSRLPP